MNTDSPPSVPRILGGGLLMGLANLVPGVSGGTMILAVGLYERFIGALADLSRLRFRRDSVVFLGLIAAGALVALVGLSGSAVVLVREQRWIMYSLFIGMTLGGAPQLVRAAGAPKASVVAAFFLAFAAMAALAWGLSHVQIPATTLVFFAMGVVAAASMILPGISGSYMLLIFGMYDVVIGSLSARALEADPSACLAVLVPVGVGAVAGMGLLSNLLKHLLARYSAVSHGALLGLLLGSVLGLWPFQSPTHPELAHKPLRKAVVLLVEGTSFEEANRRHGLDLDAARAARLRTTYAGKSAGDLKRLGDSLTPFDPKARQIAISLALLAAGFGLTQVLTRRR